ncbi:hypothetical protein V8B55DRAFT_1562948 [Mucor lusitanicus]|uniref:Replication protein A C-terminal domain-containing protein n=2 Tax=Mucor circinelloides f. lusitanicus TaxID=29924 RepID=A0A168MUH3_MUCCL|nr:hypothetical protein FB192DRAFT_1467773 [Mucor lusitanicus]OAD05381.1 hypothetical protein MUCCIDRAFT_109244 [Mucor lusitanicus CBS 277.49]
MTSHSSMGSPAFSGFNESPSEEETKGKKVLALNKSCMPLTIGLIKNHVQPMDEKFMLRDKELTNASICIVGVIRTVLVQETSVSYTIEDGTGAIDVRQWNDTEYSSSLSETGKVVDANTVGVYPRDIYVIVYGRLQSYSDRIYCVSFKTKPVENFNEVTFHYLDAVHAYLELTADKKNKSPSLSSSTIQLPALALHKISKGNISGIVKRAIKVCGDEEAGSHISSIIDHLKNVLDETQVIRCLNELAEEGQIYSLMEDYVQLVDL